MNDVQICNMALDRLGLNPIQSLDDQTREARCCKRNYELQRDSLLRKHDWGFAKSESQLALLTTTYSGWDYAYAYPGDCLKPREIFNAQDASRLDSTEVSTTSKIPIKFEVRANDAGSNKVILTDEDDAILIYTAKITNANAFDTQFVESLVVKMAAVMAYPLKRDRSMQKELMQEFLMLVGSAQASDAEESENDENDSGSFVRARA